MACLPRIALCLWLPLICLSGCKPFQQGSLSRMQTPLPAAERLAADQSTSSLNEKAKLSQVKMSDMTRDSASQSSDSNSVSAQSDSHQTNADGYCESCGVNHNASGTPSPFRFTQPLPRYQPVASPNQPTNNEQSYNRPISNEQTFSNAIRVRPLQPEEALIAKSGTTPKATKPAPPPEPDDSPSEANSTAQNTIKSDTASDSHTLAPVTLTSSTSSGTPTPGKTDLENRSPTKEGQTTPSLTATTNDSPANSREAMTKLTTAPAAPTAEKPTGDSTTSAAENNELAGKLENLKSLISNSANLDTAAEFTAELTALELLIERVRNLATSETEPSAEQSLCEHQLHALVATLRPDSLDISRPEGRQIAGRTLEHLREAIAQLEKLVSLKVSHGALCTEVRGFGQYKPFSSTEFRVGQPVLLYCEIENFCSVEEKSPADGADYRTRLKSSLVICREDGSVAQQAEFPVVEDVARNRRRDFYLYVPFAVGELSPGKYRAHLMVDDLQGRKQAVLDPPVEFSVK